LLLSQLEMNLQKNAGTLPGSTSEVLGLRSEIFRLDRLVGRILDYAKPLHLHASRIDLDHLIREVAEFYRNILRASGITIIYNSKGPVICFCDRDQMKQALINILQNSYESMEAMPAGQIEIRIDANSERVRIVIQDQGRGVFPVDQTRLFDLFFSTKDRGTGLGLTTVKKIIDAHDGQIHLESEPGNGTLVELTLPLKNVT
jgi:signal transduction histidine kinase